MRAIRHAGTFDWFHALYPQQRERGYHRRIELFKSDRARLRIRAIEFNVPPAEMSRRVILLLDAKCSEWNGACADLEKHCPGRDLLRCRRP